MRWIRTSRISVVLTGTLLAFALLPPTLAADAADPINVTVDGTAMSAEPGSTLGELLTAIRRQPAAGNVLSVSGKVLRRGAVPGTVLIHGQAAAPSTPLNEGDVIELRAGANVREPLERVLVPASGLGNPVRSIPPNYASSTYVVRGTLSKEVVREEKPGFNARSAVALTFDDGPDPTWTPRVLAVLKRYGVRATFFVTGRNAARYPQIIRALRVAGMSIQNHSWNHENLGRASWSATRDNLIATTRELRRQGMPLPRWFRPPYGSHSATTVRVARALGMRTAMWSVDPVDYQKPRASVLARRVLKAVRPGGVILLHDGGGDRSQTLGALPVIVDALLDRGYRLVTLD